MPAAATDWVWENSRAQNGALILLLAIAREIDCRGNCVMTVAELARKARLSERAVQNAARECERAGDLSVTPRVEGRRSGYALRMPKGADSAPLLAGRGAESAPRRICTPQNLHPRAEETAGQGQGADSAPQEISDVFSSSTGSHLAEVKETPAKPPSPPDRPDVERLCARLADRIEANGSKRPVISRKWRDAARLLIDKDGRTEEQVSACIDWSQADEFWRVNIQSMPTLRDKYDRLRLDAIRKQNAGKRKSRQPDDADYDEEMQIARELDRQEAAN